MSRVLDHVLQQASVFSARARNPVVAWDCIGAERWASDLRKLSEVIADKSDEDALKYMKAVRAKLDLDLTSGWSVLGSLSDMKNLDALIDPVARELTGWIVMGTHGGLDNGALSVRPGYRRMLGTNHCVSFCGREREEPEDAWLARRDAWLSQYHPLIKVIRDRAAWGEDRVQYTAIVGTVEEFRTMRHVVERELTEGTLLLRSNGFKNSIRVAHAGPLNRDDGVEFLARPEPEDGEEYLPAGAILETKYGRCQLVH